MAEIFDSIAPEYDDWYTGEVGSLAHSLEREMVMKFIDPHPGETVLDLGCGTGIYAIDLALMGLHVTGIDISEEMLAVAAQKASNLNLSIVLKQADIGKIDFGNEAYDKVISISAMEFFPNPAEVIRRAYQAVKPGGRMVFATIGAGSSWSALYESKAKADPDHLFNRATFYTGRQLMDLFSEGKSSLAGCLYFPPDLKPFSREAALAIEKQAIASGDATPAFVCGLWEKMV